VKLLLLLTHCCLCFQLRIRVECAFGILVSRWAILRSIMPKRLSINRIVALVCTLCRLHNFCIDAADIPSPTEDEYYSSALDTANLRSRSVLTGSDVVGLITIADCDIPLPRELLGVGEHGEGALRTYDRRHERTEAERRQDIPGPLPREVLCAKVVASHKVRKRGRQEPLS